MVFAFLISATKNALVFSNASILRRNWPVLRLKNSRKSFFVIRSSLAVCEYFTFLSWICLAAGTYPLRYVKSTQKSPLPALLQGRFVQCIAKYLPFRFGN